MQKLAPVDRNGQPDEGQCQEVIWGIEEQISKSLWEEAAQRDLGTRQRPMGAGAWTSREDPEGHDEGMLDIPVPHKLGLDVRGLSTSPR